MNRRFFGWLALVLTLSSASAQVAGKKAAAAVGVKVDWLNLSSVADMYRNALGLTDGQYQTVKDLAEKRQYQVGQNLADMKDAMALVDAERIKDDPDTGLIKVTLQKHARLQVDNEMIRFNFPFECREILTGDQIAKWKTIRLTVESRMKAIRETTGKKGEESPAP